MPALCLYQVPITAEKADTAGVKFRMISTLSMAGIESVSFGCSCSCKSLSTRSHVFLTISQIHYHIILVHLYIVEICSQELEAVICGRIQVGHKPTNVSSI